MTVEILEQQEIFVSNSPEENTQSLANYFPNGDFFRAKNIADSNFRKYLKALSYEFTRAEEKIKELADEHYIPLTFNLIEEWEKHLSIPDECFTIKGKTIEERRKQVIAKFALMNLTTTQDFIDLAAYFDVDIDILNGYEHSNFFPFTFPIYFFGSIKEAKFTMIVYFKNIDRPLNAFPMTFPVTFQPATENLVLCLFEKLKPAPVKIIARYRND
jgi:uncharacterized protein YmfQ (DUF2313 family)